MGAAEDAALDAWLVPRVRPRTVVRLERTDAPMAPTAARFGGTPYLVAGETWPMCVCGLPLAFICQLPVDTGLVAFYFCWDCFPQDPEPGPWTLRMYDDPRDDNAITIAQPDGARVTERCAVRFEAGRSLPVWEGRECDAPELRALARAANSESPWEAYTAACERCAGPQEIVSAIGGYPHWLQSDEHPEGTRFMASVDTEEAAGITWGDVGMVYLFIADADADAPGPLMVLQSL